jgi:hypothetical protein
MRLALKDPTPAATIVANHSDQCATGSAKTFGTTPRPIMIATPTSIDMTSLTGHIARPLQ